MIEILSKISMILGVLFMFIAALGLWLLPDVYMRIHAPTKAATLGLFFLIMAFVLSTWEQDIPFKIVLVLLFIGATIPIGSHILARAAYRAGTSHKAPLALDEYKGQASSASIKAASQLWDQAPQASPPKENVRQPHPSD